MGAAEAVPEHVEQDRAQPGSCRSLVMKLTRSAVASQKRFLDEVLGLNPREPASHRVEPWKARHDQRGKARRAVRLRGVFLWHQLLMVKDDVHAEVIASASRRNRLRPGYVIGIRAGTQRRRQINGQEVSSEMATVTTRNGINVEQLMATIGAIRSTPDVAKMTFKATTEWHEGTHSIAKVGTFEHAGKTDTSRRTGQFELQGDEPPVLLGNNLGPNAVELCLAALGFCYAVGYVANAAAKGIELEELSYEVAGDIDLHTFLGLGRPGDRAGFTEIRVRGRVRAKNADREQLESLCTYVQDTSPVGDILAHRVPLIVDLEVA